MLAAGPAQTAEFGAQPISYSNWSLAIYPFWAFLHFMNLFLLLLSLVFYGIHSFNSAYDSFCKFQYLHAVKQNDNMYV